MVSDPISEDQLLALLAGVVLWDSIAYIDNYQTNNSKIFKHLI
jgi:hypothetical protein